MFISKNEKEIKWYWFDQKMHTIRIIFEDESIDIKELYASAAKIVEDKDEMCKNISYLGVALTGSPDAAWGFLLGWLIRSIKNDSKWTIEHTEEELPEDEVIEHLATLMEESARLIREQKGQELPKLSTPSIGGPGATELFGK